MNGRAGALLLLLVVPSLAGCFGPPPGAATATRFQPYTHYAHASYPGVDAREPACDDQGHCTEYYLVRVSGSENVTLVSGSDVQRTCAKDWLFDIVQGNHSVAYNATKYTSLQPAAINTLVAEDFWGVAFGPDAALHGCPTLYGLRDYPRTPPPTYKRIIGNYGLAEIKVFRDGTIALGTQSVFGIGERLVVSYGRLHSVGDTTYFVQGGFEVVNLGPWPIGNLQPGSGAVTRPG